MTGFPNSTFQKGFNSPEKSSDNPEGVGDAKGASVGVKEAVGVSAGKGVSGEVDVGLAGIPITFSVVPVGVKSSGVEVN
jgi:hypothetical protein